MSKQIFAQLQYSDGTPEPEPWLNSSYLRGRDKHYTELHSQSRRSVALSSQTSGYFSTNGSVYNSTRRDNRPDSRHSVAYRRESLTSQDTGSTICYYNFIGSTVHLSTTPTTSLPGVQDEIHVCMGIELKVVSYIFILKHYHSICENSTSD